MSGQQKKIISTSIHITGHCNYHCDHCFDRCLTKEILTPDQWQPILDYLKELGIDKITFAGGEPLRYPYLDEMLDRIHRMGFTTSIVSNGSLITEEWLKSKKGILKWVGLSIDSPLESDEIEIGRHRNGTHHLEHVAQVAKWAHECGIKVKLNVTVVRRSWFRDFREYFERIDADRIKVFRALTLKDANDDIPDAWSVTDEQFAAFRNLHKDCKEIYFEDNEDMCGTYLMFDPIGRWMLDSGGVKRFEPLEKLKKYGIASQVNVDRYLERNGIYNW